MTLTSGTALAALLGLGFVACSSAVARAPEGETRHGSLGHHAVDRTLVAGTLVEATIHSSLSRHRNQPGTTLLATVSADVSNSHRWVVIPRGCAVGLQIADWRLVAPRRASGKILLDVTSVTVRGQVYPVHVTIEVAPGARYQATGEVMVAPGTRILFVLPEGFTAASQLD